MLKMLYNNIAIRYNAQVMNIAFPQLVCTLIILLMLFTQSVMLEHAIDHTEAEHTEHCAAFIIADQASDCDIKLVSFEAVNIANDWFQLNYLSKVQTKRLNQLSRAPPFKRTV